MFTAKNESDPLPWKRVRFSKEFKNKAPADVRLDGIACMSNAGDPWCFTSDAPFEIRISRAEWDAEEAKLAPPVGDEGVPSWPATRTVFQR